MSKPVIKNNRNLRSPQVQNALIAIVRAEAKSGTDHFHGYATVSIVHDHQRYILALRFVEKGESMEKIVAWLLNRQKSVGITIRFAYLEKE